jgi:hypothetical protein
MSRRVPDLSSGSRLGPPEALPGARPPGAQITQIRTFASLPKADCAAAHNWADIACQALRSANYGA